MLFCCLVVLHNSSAQSSVPTELRGFELGRHCTQLQPAIEQNRQAGIALYPAASGERHCEINKETGGLNKPILGRMQQGRYKEIIWTDFSETGRLGNISVDTVWFENAISDSPSVDILVNGLIKEYGAPSAYSQSESTQHGFFSPEMFTTNSTYMAWTSTPDTTETGTSTLVIEEFSRFTKRVPNTLLIAVVSTSKSAETKSVALKLTLSDARVFRDAPSPTIKLR